MTTIDNQIFMTYLFTYWRRKRDALSDPGKRVQQDQVMAALWATFLISESPFKQACGPPTKKKATLTRGCHYLILRRKRDSNPRYA